MRPLKNTSWFAKSCGTSALRVRVWGAHPSDGSPKSWGARCLVFSLSSSGISWELKVPSRLYGSVPRLGCIVRLWLSLSFLLDVEIFSFISCAGGTQFPNFPPREPLCVPAHLIYPWEGVSSRASDVIILIPVSKYQDRLRF